MKANLYRVIVFVAIGAISIVLNQNCSKVGFSPEGAATAGKTVGNGGGDDSTDDTVATDDQTSNDDDDQTVTVMGSCGSEPIEDITLNVAKVVARSASGETLEANPIKATLHLADLAGGIAVSFGDKITASEISLVLADGNSYKDAQGVHDLRAPSAADSGFKLFLEPRAQVFQKAQVHMLHGEFDQATQLKANAGGCMLLPTWHGVAVD